MPSVDKIVIVTKRTDLEGLVERFNTREQARFYIEHMGASFAEYERAHEVYQTALAALKRQLPDGIRSQLIDRSFLPNFTFGERDLVCTLGPDGLVVNTAKYLDGQPLLALNPDPDRIDGVLVPFGAGNAGVMLRRALKGDAVARAVSMARVELNDGQSLHAVNDFFLGQRTHVSARYRLRHPIGEEDQSSSGIIISTGAGSTGWYRSVLTGASSVVGALVPTDDVARVRQQYQFDWEARRLVFSVREPFPSKHSAANLVYGGIDEGQWLEVVSHMPQNGVIFSDGVEEDYLQFNSGAIARFGLADKRLNLIVAA
jgi:NAD kinase